MHLTRLALTDFRSYADASVELGPGVTAFTGLNGAGKTEREPDYRYVLMPIRSA